MDKLKLHTPDFTEANIAKLAELFPNCVTETQDEKGELKRVIDFDLLKQELSTSVVEGPQERYQLNWPGKREALLTANAPIAKTLRPCRQESVNFDTTQNLYIEGDNLDALKLLQETYLGKVKMIYIDPPYNTGKDFIYEDDFAENTKAYLQRSNQKDDVGNRLVSNNESNGRFHSDWLTMIYSRLKLVRSLLTDDGFLIVSIDDAESKNIQHLLSEVFGEDNCIATLVWDKNRKNDAKFFSVGHEYMHIYAKSKQDLMSKGVVLREQKAGIKDAHYLFQELLNKYGGELSLVQEAWRKHFNSISNDRPEKKLGRYSKISDKGPFRDDGNISWPGGGGPKYEIIHPLTKKPCKVPDGGWRYSKAETFWNEVADGRVVFGPDELTLPRQCRYLFEGDGQVMTSVHYSYAQTAAVEFLDLMRNRVFENPKNWRDIYRLIGYLLNKDGDIILDFFAGSATTAHAVMAINADDGIKRKFILVQLPEACNEKSEALKEGYKNITDIGKERIRRAGQKIKQDNADKPGIEQLDIGFRVLKIDSSNMNPVFYTPDKVNQDDLFASVDNVREDRNDEDLLFQVLLDWGVDLTLPINQETIAGMPVLFVDGNALAACFDKTGGINEDFIKQLAARKPLRAVFRDAGFANDSVKINVEQIFKLLSPTTEIKTL